MSTAQGPQASDSADERVAVCYLLGYARSGTTLVGNLLGQVEGWFHAGELTHLWTPGVPLPRRLCGCRLPLHACDVWRQSFALAFPHDQPPPLSSSELTSDQAASYPTIAHTLAPRTADRMMYLRRSLIPRSTLTDFAVPLRKNKARLSEYQSTVARLCRALATVTGARVLVDSSKMPADASVAATNSALDVHFVHLVRDGRGVVLSRVRGMGSRRPDDFDMRLPLAIREGLTWTLGNVVAEVVGSRGDRQVTRIGYEQFAESPERVLMQVTACMGDPATQFPFVSATEDGVQVTLGPNHTTGGNRNRWQTGQIPVREDRAWRNLSGLHRTVVTMASAPGLLRYGYLGATPAQRFRADEPAE